MQNWAKRLKTDGCCIEFKTSKNPLSEDIKNSLIQDVAVLGGLFNYVQKMSYFYSTKTWSHPRLTYFSYRLDQVLRLCFIEMTLRGISVSMDNRKAAVKENTPLTP